MQVQSPLIIAAALALALAAGCSERAEQQPTAAAPPANQAAQNADAPGTTTTFEESTPEPQQ